MATLPVKSIALALRESGIPAKVSNSPSTYLCNQMMYTVLHLIAEKGMKTRAGFIHVPAHPALVAQQVYPFVEMPSMSVEMMASAVKTAVQTTLATANDTPYGLSSGICTTSLKHATHYKRNAEAGMVMVNLPTAGVDFHVPFGGRKGSSFGSREQGKYAAEFFTTVKTSYTLP